MREGREVGERGVFGEVEGGPGREGLYVRRRRVDGRDGEGVVGVPGEDYSSLEGYWRDRGEVEGVLLCPNFVGSLDAPTTAK